MEPSELLEDNTRLVAYIQELPYQVGKPLCPIVEEGEGHTVLVDYSSSFGEYSPERHVYMATINVRQQTTHDVSADEDTANTHADKATNRSQG
jgi:hypothetical protein